MTVKKTGVKRRDFIEGHDSAIAQPVFRVDPAVIKQGFGAVSIRHCCGLHA